MVCARYVGAAALFTIPYKKLLNFLQTDNDKDDDGGSESEEENYMDAHEMCD